MQNSINKQLYVNGVPLKLGGCSTSFSMHANKKTINAT